jgi:hypothetical protein
MYQACDYFALMTVKAKGSTVVQAGWKRTFSGTKWFLTIEDGINSLTVCSSACPATGRWYNIWIRWIACDKEGSAELWVDGKLVCSSYGLNTKSYGLADRVEFGLPLLYSCAATKVYADNCVVKSYS